MSFNDLPTDCLEKILTFLPEDSLIQFCSLGLDYGFDVLKSRMSLNRFNASTCNQWTRVLKLMPKANFDVVDRQLAKIIRLDSDIDLFLIRSLILCKFPARKLIVEAVLSRSDWKFIFSWDFILSILREPDFGGRSLLFERLDYADLQRLPINTKAGLLLEGAPISIDHMVTCKAERKLILDKCKMQLMSYNWSFKKLEMCIEIGAIKKKDMAQILLTLIEQMNICFEDTIQLLVILPDKCKSGFLACKICAAMTSAFTDRDLMGVRNPFEGWNLSHRMASHLHLTLIMHNKFRTIDSWGFRGKNGGFLRCVAQNTRLKTCTCHSAKVLHSVYQMQNILTCEMITMLNVQWWKDDKVWVCVCKLDECVNKQQQIRIAKRDHLPIPDRLFEEHPEELFILFGPQRVDIAKCNISKLIVKVLDADISATISSPAELLPLIPPGYKMQLWQKSITSHRPGNLQWAMNMTYNRDWFSPNWFPNVEEMIPMLESDGVHTVRFLSRQTSFSTYKLVLLDIVIENHYFPAFITLFNCSPIVNDVDAMELLFITCFEHGFLKACTHVYFWDEETIHRLLLRYWDTWHHMCAPLSVTMSIKYVWIDTLTLDDIESLRQKPDFQSVVGNIFRTIREESIGNFICIEFIQRVKVALTRDSVVSLIHIGVNWNHIRTFLTGWAEEKPENLGLLVDCLDNSSSIYHRHWSFQLKKRVQ